MGRAIRRHRPRSPPPRYSILNPSDRLIVQHPSPASICTQSPTQPFPSVSPTQNMRECHINTQNTSPNQIRKRRTPSFRSATLFARSRSHDVQLPARRERASFRSLLYPRRNSSASLPKQIRRPSYPYIERCAHCRQRRSTFEFPQSTPTKKCRHTIRTCSYCLHNTIQQASQTRRRAGIRCPDCCELLSDGDIRRGVLLWMERG